MTVTKEQPTPPPPPNLDIVIYLTGAEASDLKMALSFAMNHQPSNSEQEVYGPNGRLTQVKDFAQRLFALFQKLEVWI